MEKSPKAVLEDFQRNLPKLQKVIPQVADAFTKRLMMDALRKGVLGTKEKELIALGCAICAACDYCIVIHVKKCFEAGATKEEIAEACGVAILMGGGPALTYATFAAKAIEEFAPDKVAQA